MIVFQLSLSYLSYNDDDLTCSTLSLSIQDKNAQEGEENVEENQENKEDRDMDEQEVRMSI